MIPLSFNPEFMSVIEKRESVADIVERSPSRQLAQEPLYQYPLL